MAEEENTNPESNESAENITETSSEEASTNAGLSLIHI